MKIIYPLPELLPDPRARFIQIMSTCYALAEAGAKVKLIAGIKRGYSKKDLLQFYGLSTHPNFEIIQLPVWRGEHNRYLRFSWHGLFHYSLLAYLLFKKRATSDIQTAIFLRHVKLANFLLRFRRFFNIPILFEVHEIFHLNTLNKRKEKNLKQIENRVYKNIDAIICLSQSLKKYLINTGVRKESVHVIPHAVKNEWFNIKRKQSGTYICYTGSLYLWKGVDTLISAMKYLPTEKLMIVGGGNRIEDLKKLAEKENIADRVRFAGNVPHNLIPQYLSEAKIVVLPNNSEGPSLLSSPLKLFEYMASGIPIVSSDLPALKEVLADGKNAILFEPGNPKALANSIKRFIDDSELASRLSNAARSDAGEYTYTKRAEKIVKVLQKLTFSAIAGGSAY